VDYSGLANNMALLQSVEVAVRNSVVAEAGNNISESDVSVRIYPGSVVAVATIVPPPQASFGEVAFTLTNTSSSLGSAVATEVAALPGIEAVTSSPIEVTGVSVGVAMTTTQVSTTPSTTTRRLTSPPRTTTTTQAPTMVVVTLLLDGFEWTLLNGNDGVSAGVELALQDSLVQLSNGQAMFDNVMVYWEQADNSRIRAYGVLTPLPGVSVKNLQVTLSSPYVDVASAVEGRLMEVEFLDRVLDSNRDLAIELQSIVSATEAPSIPTTTFLMVLQSSASRSALSFLATVLAAAARLVPLS